MIPSDFISEWREYASWNTDIQVEQDLVISRCLVEVFSDAQLQELLAFRGGTALYKLFTPSPVRYSEDIDLVRTTSGPIGSVIDLLRSKLDSIFEQKSTSRSDSLFTVNYRYSAEDAASTLTRVKVEINTRECDALYGYEFKSIDVKNRWFTGSADIRTYSIEELLGTKLRALYQRRKGRDLFDIWYFCRHGHVDLKKLVGAFKHYTHATVIRRADFEANLQRKVSSSGYRSDVDNYLLPSATWSIDEAKDFVISSILTLL